LLKNKEIIKYYYLGAVTGKALMKIKKKGSSSLFFLFYLFLLLISFFLILDADLFKFFFLKYRQERVRREVTEEINRGLEREILLLLEFTLEEVREKLKWRTIREFEFNHELYDVVDSTIENDKVLFWCLPDREETELEREIKEVVFSSLKYRGKSFTWQQGSTSTAKIWLFFLSPDLVFSAPYLFSNLNISLFKVNYFFTLQHPTPPPRSLISMKF